MSSGMNWLKKLKRLKISEGVKKKCHILEDIRNKLKFIEKAASPKDPKEQQRISELREKNNLSNTLELAEFLADMDPTGNEGVYVLWILRTYMKDRNVRLPEDSDRIRRALHKFTKIKNKRSYEDEKDINRIGLKRGLQELEAIVGKYKLEEEYNSVRGFRNFIQDKANACIRLIYSDKQFDYYVIESTGEEIEAISVRRKSGRDEYIPKNLATAEEIAQARRHGSDPNTYKIDVAAFVLADIAKKGTVWCVANEYSAHHYLQGSFGRMYIMYKHGEPYYLATDNYSEVMSAGDVQIPLASHVSYQLLVAFARMILDEAISSQLTESSKSQMKLKLRSAINVAEKDRRLSNEQKEKLVGLFKRASNLAFMAGE
jgi:hypothetical protein